MTVYNDPKSENSIDHLCYILFVKSAKLNKLVAVQHINRVYSQIQTWFGKDLETQE